MPDARDAVRARSGGRCEVRMPGCSVVATGMHHRYMKGRIDTIENLLDVCAECHTQSPQAIHRNVAESYANGLLVHSWDGLPDRQWEGLPR